MLRRFTIPVLLSCALSSQFLSAQVPSDTAALSQRIDAYLQSAFNTGHFNGVALIARSGHIIFKKGYGWKDFEDKSLNDNSTIFQIGSLTKPFTAVLILKLQEDGKLSVNDKVSKYFPAQKDGNQITLQNLLNHTSGLVNYTDVIGPEDSAIISHPVEKQLVLKQFEDQAVHFKPGTRFEYCNSDYYLLGIIIENLTGMTYEQAVRKFIFDPLAMTHSGFDFIHLHSTEKATGYVKLDSMHHYHAVLMDSTVTYAAGGIYSNVADLYRWAQAIGKKQLLSEKSWEQAFTPGLDNYGDGWWIDTLYDHSFITHSGGLQGFMSNFVYYPDADATIILLTNVGDYGGNLSPINTGLSAILFGKPYQPWAKYKEQTVDTALMQVYTGTYRLNNEHQLLVTQKDGKLFIEATNPKDRLPRLELHAQNANTFYIKEAPLRFQFIFNTSHVPEKIVTFNTRGKDAEWIKNK